MADLRLALIITCAIGYAALLLLMAWRRPGYPFFMAYLAVLTLQGFQWVSWEAFESWKGYDPLLRILKAAAVFEAYWLVSRRGRRPLAVFLIAAGMVLAASTALPDYAAFYRTRQQYHLALAGFCVAQWLYYALYPPEADQRDLMHSRILASLILAFAISGAIQWHSAETEAARWRLWYIQGLVFRMSVLCCVGCWLWIFGRSQSLRTT